MISKTKAYTILKRNLQPWIKALFWTPIIAAIATIISSASVSALPLQLPADEDGLAELLSDRTIDTLEYEQLLAFYALPLSVPRGELIYLTLLFPETADMIPAGFEELSSYQPFDNAQIRRFFNDYPVLEGFEPILRFNTAETPEDPKGEVVVGINRSKIRELKGHRIRFRRKGDILSIEGALALSDTAVTWQSRRADLSYKNFSAQIGNFKQPVPGELTFGRLVRNVHPVHNVHNSLLYAENAPWNGVSVNAKEIFSLPLQAVAFYHLRPSESSWGAGLSLNVNKTKLFAGLTGFNEYYYAHLYAEYKTKTVSATAEAAAPLAEENATPALSLHLNYRVKGSSAEYHAVLYPINDDDAFPMSRLKKKLLAEAGGEEFFAPFIQKHIVRMTVPFINDAVKLIPELDFTESGGVKRIQGQIESRTRVGYADVTVKHTAKIFTTFAADSALHATGATVNWQTPYPVAIRASFQRDYGHYKKTKNIYAVEVPTTIIPSTVISPYIRGKYTSVNEYLFGVKSEFHLYKKTWTGVTLEIPVNAKGEGDVYVKVSSSYSF